MKRTRCTAHREHGRSKTKAHGVTADCTRVRIYNEAGVLLITRWVCAACRRRMKLPDRDIDMQPGRVEVSDEIHDPDVDELLEEAEAAAAADRQEFRLPYATGGLVDPDKVPTVGDRGPDEFRLP